MVNRMGCLRVGIIIYYLYQILYKTWLWYKLFLLIKMAYLVILLVYNNIIYSNIYTLKIIPLIIDKPALIKLGAVLRIQA